VFAHVDSVLTEQRHGGKRNMTKPARSAATSWRARTGALRGIIATFHALIVTFACFDQATLPRLRPQFAAGW
jgi:hypothetical protein